MSATKEIRVNGLRRVKRELKFHRIDISSDSSSTSSFTLSDHSRDFREDSFIFIGETCNIPKNSQAPSEDAFFSTSKGVGISDGVGGWKNNYGIDCFRFSKTLMQEC